MTEKEYWGILTKEVFESKLQEFKEKFGDPKNKKRLSLELGDWTRPGVDTRIKITNGKPELVQKLGEWNSREREEIEIPLTADAEAIFQMHRAIVNLLNAKEPSQLIIQHDNYLFDTPDGEIKLSHQFGKSDKYTFEVELKNEERDLDRICEELGLEPDNEPKDKAFWDKWNSELNLDARELTEGDIKILIKTYL